MKARGTIFNALSVSYHGRLKKKRDCLWETQANAVRHCGCNDPLSKPLGAMRTEVHGGARRERERRPGAGQVLRQQVAANGQSVPHSWDDLGHCCQTDKPLIKRL